MISKELFSESFYYIAPGFDFEPLFRFSHLCNTFLYANLWYTKEEVLENIKSKFLDNPFLEIKSIIEFDDFDELKYFEIHPDYKNHLQASLKNFSERETNNYFSAFKAATNENQWMIEVNLIRKRINRPIKLYYFTGEGLASYTVLSQAGFFPPKVLCTIQTGVLENANGLMNRFLLPNKNLPFIWLRGIEPDFENNDHWDSAFDKDSIFNKIGMDFNFHWSVNASYNTYSSPSNNVTKRFCKAYITEAVENEIRIKKFRSYESSAIMNGKIQKIVDINTTEKTLVLAPSRLTGIFPTNNSNIHITAWDEVIDTTSILSLSVSLDYISNIDKLNKYDAIYFTINGLEDEGVLLNNFMIMKHNSKMFPIIRRPLDFYDLRV